MQRIRAIFHFLSCRDTLIAAVGHFFWQIPQNIHLAISIFSLPRLFSRDIAGPNGYFTVAGLEKRFFKTVLAIKKIDIAYLSVQLTQGSIVRIKTGTSANSHPCSNFNNAARLENVGVRTLKRSKKFVPLAFR